MPMINHINYRNENNEVYCCLRNKIVKLDAAQQGQFCSSCKMYNGAAQGKGVECTWEDLRDVSNPHIVRNPLVEFSQNQKRQISPEGPAMLFIAPW
jgi:hypothetical protein